MFLGNLQAQRLDSCFNVFRFVWILSFFVGNCATLGVKFEVYKDFASCFGCWAYVPIYGLLREVATKMFSFKRNHAIICKLILKCLN